MKSNKEMISIFLKNISSLMEDEGNNFSFEFENQIERIQDEDGKPLLSETGLKTFIIKVNHDIPYENKLNN